MKKILSSLVLILFLLSMGSCIIRTPVRHSGPKAPPPKTGYRSKAPRPGYVWAKGHWEWRRGRWVWVNGYWMRPRSGHRWVPGHYETRGGRDVWVPGHWQRIR